MQKTIEAIMNDPKVIGIAIILYLLSLPWIIRNWKYQKWMEKNYGRKNWKKRRAKRR